MAVAFAVAHTLILKFHRMRGVIPERVGKMTGALPSGFLKIFPRHERVDDLALQCIRSPAQAGKREVAGYVRFATPLA